MLTVVSVVLYILLVFDLLKQILILILPMYTMYILYLYNFISEKIRRF